MKKTGQREGQAAQAVDQALHGFTQALQHAAQPGQAEGLQRLVLSGPRSTDTNQAQQVSVKPWRLRGQLHWSLRSRYAQRDEVCNLLPQQATQALSAQLVNGFNNALLEHEGVQWQLRRSRKGRWSLARQCLPDAPACGGDTAANGHERRKAHALTLQAPFLHGLGLTDSHGQLVPNMARKWRQINRFIELVMPALERGGCLGARHGPLKVADFGCGKGYLTFALHHVLSVQHGLEVEVTGVELRQGLVDEANALAQRMGASARGLRFVCGDVARHAAEGVDVMVALHACDTATDMALHAGIAASAGVIVSAPCCHKELRPQMRAPLGMAPLLKHGIHMTRQAEMLTDALRALLLEGAGYEAKVIEFVAPEHTQQNKMILAVRPSQPNGHAQRQAQTQAQAQEDARALAALYGVGEQTLLRLLQQRAALPTPPEALSSEPIKAHPAAPGVEPGP